VASGKINAEIETPATGGAMSLLLSEQIILEVFLIPISPYI
jgi:hypothetical protein